MKKYLPYLLFLPIGTALSIGVDELLVYLDQAFAWSLGEKSITYTSIIISCLVGFPLAHYLSAKILKHKTPNDNDSSN